MGFWEKLRTTDDSTKEKLTVIFTVIAMTIVVVLWLLYFNGLFASYSTSSNVAADDGSTNNAPPVSMRERAAGMLHIFMEKMGSLGNLFNSQKVYNVTP